MDGGDSERQEIISGWCTGFMASRLGNENKRRKTLQDAVLAGMEWNGMGWVRLGLC